MHKRRILAFLLSIVIVAQSGFTALAAQAPAVTSEMTVVTSAKEAEEEVSELEEDASSTPEEEEEETSEPEETPTPESEETPEPEEEETPMPEEEETPEPEETPTPEAEVTPTETVTPEVGEMPQISPTPEEGTLTESPSPTILPEATPGEMPGEDVTASPSPSLSPSPSATPTPSVGPEGLVKADENPSGDCSANDGESEVRWEVDLDTNTLIISGTGAMKEALNAAYSPWKAYNDEVKYLVIEEGITSIGGYGLQALDNLQGKLVLPESLERIGDDFFWVQPGFTGELKIPDSVTYIGDNAFGGSTGFKGELKIPDGVTYIGANAFSNCPGLTGDLILPDSVEYIGATAFYKCNFDGKLKLPENEAFTSISDSTFCECDFTGKIVIPRYVTEIASSAFLLNTTSLIEFYVSPNVTTIANYAFGYTGVKERIIYGEEGSAIETAAAAYWYMTFIPYDFSDWDLVGKDVYTVTFDSKGGSTIEAANVIEGKTVEEPIKPTKEGWLFAGWYLNDTKYDFSQPVQKSITLTAKWMQRTESTLKNVTGLNKEQLAQLAPELGDAADKVLTTAKISGSAIALTGTLKAVYQAELDELKYYMALRIVPDASAFDKAEGLVEVAYRTGEDGQIPVALSMSQEAKEAGYWDILIDYSYPISDFTITIDNDAADTQELETVYMPKTYSVNLNGVKKDEASSVFYGVVKESAEFGIESSYPRVINQDKWENVTLAYDVLSYTAQAEVGSSDKHYYVTAFVPIPELMKGTDGLEASTVIQIAGKTQGVDYDYLFDENAGGFHIWVQVEEGFEEELTVNWNGRRLQTITLKAADDCYFEVIREGIQLPKKLAFNGIAKSMVVGQSLAADITITKSYQEDKVQVVFASSNTDVISINKVTGMMKALKPGTATITVSAVDAEGNVSKVKGTYATAKITVGTLKAPASIKVSNIKDTEVTVSWKADASASCTEIYAVPFSSEMGTKAANWKSYIENAIANESIYDIEGVVCQVASAGEAKADIVGLVAKTGYVFYLRNMVENAVEETIFAGTISGKTTTKDKIFAQVVLHALDATGNELIAEEAVDGIPVFEVKDGVGLPTKVSYKLCDIMGNEENATYTKPAYKSSNAKVVKVDKNGKLTLGGQTGSARVYVTGKDGSGVVRESEGITIRVIKAPTTLSKKNTKMAIGTSMQLTSFIKTNVAGSASEVDFSKLDIEDIKTQFATMDGLKLVGADGDLASLDVQDIMIVATKASGSKNITFKLKEGDTVISQAVATITLTDMTAPTIKKVVTRDETAEVQFVPSNSVHEVSGSEYYYSAQLTDNVTGEKLTLTALLPEETYSGSGYAYQFAEGDSLYGCKLYGLSSNKSYTVVVTAHCDLDGNQHLKASKVMKFTTQKELLTQGGSIGVSYIELDELREEVNNRGTVIDYANEDGVVLINNTTYAFFADVSNLARALETEKLSWSITTGNKKAAVVKPSASTYEVQVTTQRTGVFTLTATSNVTKEAVASFTVTVIPYQSKPGSGATGQSAAVSFQSELFYYYQGEKNTRLLEEEELTEAV